MSRYLNAIYMALLLAGLTAGTAFATTVSFSDSDVTPSFANNQWTWTHILDNNEFTPNLVSGDSINVTDALLSIQMDFTRFNPGGGGIKLFEVTSTGDTLFLANLDKDGSAGTVHDAVFNIDLDSLINGSDILTALNDKSFVVTLLLQANKGTIDHIDSSVLSGHASILTDGTDQQPSTVPEPGTLLLLGSGLIGLGLLGRTRKR